MNTIYIDHIIFNLQRTGGISVMWYEHLYRLLKEHAFELKFLEYKGGSNIFRSKINVPKQKLIMKSNFLLSLRRYANPRIRQKKEPFLFHSSYYRYCKNPQAINIITVYDFTYEYYSSGLKKKVHCWQKYRAIRHSDVIICISENTKKDLLKFLPDIDEEKIRVIYIAVSDEYFVLKEQNTQGLPFEAGSYALFVGSRADYKNFDLAVNALAGTTMNMVIVGNELTAKELCLLDEKLKDRYKWVGRVSNQLLNIFYNHAFCFLYPSTYEGFGIPVLEAQKAGCPVIAYNASSIPEIIGKTPLLLEELSEEAVMNCFELLQNKQVRAEIVQAGLKNVERFSWDKTYEKVYAVYEEVLKQKLTVV